MLICTLALLCVIILHVAGPFPTFFKVQTVSAIPGSLMVTCIAHAIIEEYVFRHLFWNMLPPKIASRNRASLIWLNVLVFWTAHILILYHSEYSASSNLNVYNSTCYNMSVVFMALMMNSLYLETGPMSLANCILAHALILIVWSIFLGGSEDGYYDKYQPPQILREAYMLLNRYMKDAFPHHTTQG